MVLPSENDLRLELRTRNNRLWHLVFDTYPSVRAFCEAHKLQEGQVGAFLNLSTSPYGKRGACACAQRLAAIASMLVEDLFPPELYSGVMPRRFVAEIPSKAYVSLSMAKHLALPPSQDELVLARETREAVEEALAGLSPRAQVVIRNRFGLTGDGYTRTLEACGTKIGVSGARAAQIGVTALNKLRRDRRLRRLWRASGTMEAG